VTGLDGQYPIQLGVLREGVTDRERGIPLGRKPFATTAVRDDQNVVEYRFSTVAPRATRVRLGGQPHSLGRAIGPRCVVDREFSRKARMVGMGIREHARGTWFFVGVGALIGVVLGILVSVTTDVPLAPEAGLILGALAGWLFRRVST